MNLIRLCLDRPVGVSVGVLLVVLSGILSLLAVPVQLTPNVDSPVISVGTRWAGAGPQEIEREIVDRQEEQLRTVKGLRRMTSDSQDDFGSITLEFYDDVDKSEALQDVNDKLRQVGNYPPEVDQPTVRAADTARDSEIAWLILRATDGKTERLPEMETFARDHIKPYLDRVKGVASTDVYGGREREVQVRVNAARLAARGLTLRQVEQALRLQNQDKSAGTRAQGKRDYTIRTVGQYRSMEEIERTVIADTPGGPVYVRDVAEAIDGFRKQRNFVRSRGEYVLAFPVRREVGTNVMQVMRGVREAVQRVNDEVLKPRNMNLELLQIYDETVYIDQSIDMVRTNGLYGGLLTIGVLMLFLRNWRATAAVALSIPISLIGAFVLMWATGRTLNVISLAGIAFAIGMVVDNAIVVLENIYRHNQMGKSVSQACFDGPNEVWSAVLASTLTTLVVFVPVILMREEAGQLFRDISVATVMAVALSLAVAFTVTPVLARRLLTLGRGETAPLAGERRMLKSSSLVGDIAARLYDLLARNRAIRLAIVVVMTFGSLWLARLLVPDATYLPSGNRNLVFGMLFTPPGYSMDEFKRMALLIEERISPYWTAQPGSAEQRQLDQRWIAQAQGMIDANAIPELSGDTATKLSWLERDRVRREWLTPPPLIEDFFFVTYNGFTFMGATSRDPARVKPLVRLLQTAGASIPGTFAFFKQTDLFREGGGNNLEISVRADNLDQLVSSAGSLMGSLMRVYDYPQPNPANFALGRPEVQVNPDRVRCASAGLTAADVGLVVEACVDGAYVGDYRPGGSETLDIRLQLRNAEGDTSQQIGQVPIYTPAGTLVPLSAVCRIQDTTSLEVIRRVERQRAVEFTVSPGETKSLETVINDIQKQVDELRSAGAIGPGVTVGFTGNADKLRTARASLVGEWKGWSLESLLNIISARFVLSIIVCYLLMVALYESWLYPFVIMFSVPLAIFGGFLGLWVCHQGTLMTTDQPVQQLDVLTFLGFVILVGTVVNNAILLVDQSLQNLRSHGMSLHTAVREATRARTRPVLMTSLTTVFGQLPLALMPGAGSELYRGLAAVVVGGMIVSTFGTLVLVPAVLTMVIEIRQALRGVAEHSPVASGAASPAPVVHDR
ncbi:MAG: efflux RND transporter permease subunit [Phycisphaerae bacterium]